MAKELPPVPTLNAVAEQPHHYKYLKEFRVSPCQLFKQHQCQQHRPYTCFHWHFANQRRRPPQRRRDGTFNYSADIYCSKYDENLGTCAEGDDCPLLHRVAGDVERKYHVRYYKTAMCVHGTDARGQCAKNGAHCAFAHSVDDVRTPVFDVREVATDARGPAHAHRPAFLVDDPAWRDHAHVVSCYKTSACRKPARLCRQGYACPYYHNAKDRRRPPATHAYRSTPCPSARAGDEWVDPSICEHQDACNYCHTRTEQQFHPDIYKSSKCNDVLQQRNCPRGPFCAFAHDELELHAEYTPVPPPPEKPADAPISDEARALAARALLPQLVDLPECPVPPSGSAVGQHIHRHRDTGAVTCGSVPGSYSAALKHASRMPFDTLPVVPRAIGSERSLACGADASPVRTWTPADFEVARLGRARTTSLNIHSGAMSGDSGYMGLGSLCDSPNSVDVLHRGRAASFGNGAPTTAELLGALDTSSEEHLPPIRENDECHELAPFTFGSFDDPAPRASTRSHLSGDSRLADALFPMSLDAPVGDDACAADADKSTAALSRELQRARAELASHKAKLGAWEDGLKQARQACEAWHSEADSHRARANALDDTCQRVTRERDMALAQVGQLQAQLLLITQTLNSAHPLRALPMNGAPAGGADAAAVLVALQGGGRGALCSRCGRVVQHGSVGCALCAPTAKSMP